MALRREVSACSDVRSPGQTLALRAPRHAKHCSPSKVIVRKQTHYLHYLAILVSVVLTVSPGSVTWVFSVCPTGRKGGELASAVHAYTKTGDPYVRSLVQHILSLVSHPVLSFLYRWIYDGELEDTYHEVRNAFRPQTRL